MNSNATVFMKAVMTVV